MAPRVKAPRGLRRPARSEPGDGHLGRVLDGEPVPYRRCLPAFERKFPGELAQVILLGRIRAGLAQPHLDFAVGGHRDMVMNADPGLARAVIFHRDLVGDVDRARAPDHGLARAPAAQLAFHPDLVIHSELQLELLARGDGLQGRLPDELGVMKTRAGPGSDSSDEVLVTVARRYASGARTGTARWSSAASSANRAIMVLCGPPSAGTASGRWTRYARPAPDSPSAAASGVASSSSASGAPGPADAANMAARGPR